ncbi:hypothetical protein D3C87_1841540 [compost metagenome]
MALFDRVELANDRISGEELSLGNRIIGRLVAAVHRADDDHCRVLGGNRFPSDQWPFLLGTDDVLCTKNLRDVT